MYMCDLALCIYFVVHVVVLVDIQLDVDAVVVEDLVLFDLQLKVDAIVAEDLVLVDLRLEVDAIVADDLILVDLRHDVGCVDEDSDRASDRDEHEDDELQAVDHHRDVVPVLQNLHRKQ